MKRLFSCLLCLAMLSLILPTALAQEDELMRAAHYGFIPNDLPNEDLHSVVSYAEFMSMLDTAVSHIDASRLPDWKATYSKARESSDPINWGNATIAIFSAAEFLGSDIYARNCDDLGEGAYDGDWIPAAFWGNVERPPVGFEGMTEETVAGDFMNWGSHYVTSRGSVVSGNTIYTYDEGERFIRADRQLSQREAALAALRFYESTITIQERYPNEDDVSLLAEVDARKYEILNSPTDVEYNGIAYYVSNEGSDENSGTSPDQPWSSLDKVNKAGIDGLLQPGDAVFFERGGLWRGFINCAQGVTYSAYGVGDKPRIYGSEEDGSGAEKWNLWYGENGVKIWKFYRDISEVGNIVFDDGKSYATRIYAYFNGKEWVNSGEDATPFNISERLVDNLTFYSTFEVTPDEYKKFAREQSAWGIVYTDLLDTTGELYLRCDAGNPGELYTSIEFHMQPEGLDGYVGLVNPAGDNVIDNLCLKYSLVNGIAIYGTDRYHSDNNGNTIQNCEIGWTGGTQHELKNPDGILMVCGENIAFKTDNNKFLNNYMYQSACGGFVSEFVKGDWEGSSDPMCRNTVICGNIIEKCQDSFWFWSNVFEGDPNKVFWENTLITDNYALYAGYGWSGDKRFTYPNQLVNRYHPDGDTWLFAIGGNASEIKDMHVLNNVFYLSNGGWIIQFPGMYEGTCDVTFDANTYVQNDNRQILFHDMSIKSLTLTKIRSDIENYIGDMNAILFETSVALQ